MCVNGRRVHHVPRVHTLCLEEDLLIGPGSGNFVGCAKGDTLHVPCGLVSTLHSRNVTADGQLTPRARDVGPAVVIVRPERCARVVGKDCLVVFWVVEAVACELVAVPVLVRVQVGGLALGDTCKIEVHCVE